MTVAIILNGVTHYGQNYEAHTDCLTRLVREAFPDDEVAQAKLLDQIDSGEASIEFGYAKRMEPTGFTSVGSEDDGQSWRRRDYVSNTRSDIVQPATDTDDMEPMGSETPGYSADAICNCAWCCKDRAEHGEGFKPTPKPADILDTPLDDGETAPI